jgi:hypothetical protein
VENPPTPADLPHPGHAKGGLRSGTGTERLLAQVRRRGYGPRVVNSAPARRPPPTLDRARSEANRLISYHSAISGPMTTERTSLESGLIPVSAYILVACCEAWYRYPEMMARIDRARPAEDLGRAGRRPGSQINPVYLWSIANCYLVGRKALVPLGMAVDDPLRTWGVLDFWERAARSFRSDGHAQAADAGGVVRSYDDEVVKALVEGAAPVGAEGARLTPEEVGRFSATLMSYLFLLYFDTRVGTGDSGPYRLGDGRVLLVRDFYRLSTSDMWWSEVAGGVPYQNLTAGLVLKDVSVRVNDWGTSLTEPEDYLDRLVGFSLFTTDGPTGSLRGVPLEEMEGIAAAVASAQARHYRNVASMEREEKIRCGAYVYFSFLRPFAEAAGVAGDLDWSVPRDLPEPLYQLLQAYDGANSVADPDEDWYSPIE